MVVLLVENRLNLYLACFLMLRQIVCSNINPYNCTKQKIFLLKWLEMINKILSVLFLFSLSLPSFSQAKGLKCRYVSTMPMLPGILKLPNEYTRNVMIERINNDHKVYTLTIANGKSLFVKEPESVDKIPLERDVQRILLNLNDSSCITQCKYYDKQYLINDSLKQASWNIDWTQQEVAGYPCYKATLASNKKIIAWFTTDIPTNHAPLGYYGQPGLVVKMKLPIFILDLKSVEEVENVSMEAPKEGIPMTQEDFDKVVSGGFQKLIKDKPVNVIE